MDDSGKIVEPAVPMFLGKLDTGGRRATRLDFANWIVSTQNPLTARVYVNRLWQRVLRDRDFQGSNDLGRKASGRVIWNSSIGWPAEFMQPKWKRGYASVGREAHGSHDRDEPHVSAVVAEQAATSRERPGQPPHGPAEPMRVDAEVVHDIALSSVGTSGREVRRTQRSPISRTCTGRR